MSRYTTELRYICETYAGLEHSEGFNKIDEIVDAAEPKLFDFSYPQVDTVDYSRIHKKIMVEYYTREIGFETVGLFKLGLKRKLTAIMPYYNQLYETVDIKFNPLQDVDYTTTTSATNEGSRSQNTDKTNTETLDVHNARTGSSNDTYTRNDTTKNTGTVKNITNSNSHGTRKYSNTPQGGLDGVISSNFLTEAEVVDNISTDDGTRTDDTQTVVSQNEQVEKSFTDTNAETGTRENIAKDNATMQEKFMNDSTVTVVGKQGGHTYVSMIKEYRENILNIDQMIVEECADLFMLIW